MKDNSIKSVKAEYTGGNIWIFYGELENGNHFLTDDYGATLILNESPADFDKSLYEDWQKEHLVKELLLEGRANFLVDMLNALEQTDGRYISDDEINGYRDYWGFDNLTYTEIEENYCPTTDTTFLMECTYTTADKELKSMEVIGFYCGEPNADDTQFYANNRTTKAYYND